MTPKGSKNYTQAYKINQTGQLITKETIKKERNISKTIRKQNTQNTQNNQNTQKTMQQALRPVAATDARLHLYHGCIRDLMGVGFGSDAA